MKKQILTNVILGASAMVGIITVSAITKLGLKYYTKKNQNEDTDEIGEVEELA